MDPVLLVFALILLVLIANLAVLAIAQRRAEGATVRALTELGCRCETWREGIHWPGCPVLGGLRPDPRTLDDTLRGEPRA